MYEWTVMTMTHLDSGPSRVKLALRTVCCVDAVHDQVILVARLQNNDTLSRPRVTGLTRGDRVATNQIRLLQISGLIRCAHIWVSSCHMWSLADSNRHLACASALCGPMLMTRLRGLRTKAMLSPSSAWPISICTISYGHAFSGFHDRLSTPPESPHRTIISSSSTISNDSSSRLRMPHATTPSDNGAEATPLNGSIDAAYADLVSINRGSKCISDRSS